MSLDTLSYADRLFLAGLKHPLLERKALRAVQRASRLLALALGDRLSELRSSPDPLLRAFAEGEQYRILAQLLAELNEILAARWDKLPEHRRPYYTPHQRWLILQLRRLLAWSIDETARRVAQCPNTIRNWERELEGKPGQETIGSLVKPVTPIRRYADAVRMQIQMLARFGISKSAEIARVLVRAGSALSAQTVSRVRAEPPLQPGPSPVRDSKAAIPALPEPQRPNDTWVIDITQIKALFGLFSFRIACLLDAFSRFPVALRVYRAEPSAGQMADLAKAAVRRYGAPRRVVSDQGGQFRAMEFQTAVASLGAEAIFGRLGQSHSIPIVERFWRTLKENLGIRLLRPLTLAELEARAAYTAIHYAYFRPHSSLDAATPAETFHGWPAQARLARQPPRGRPGEIVAFDFPELRVVPLDPHRRHLIALKAA